MSPQTLYKFLLLTLALIIFTNECSAIRGALFRSGRSARALVDPSSIEENSRDAPIRRYPLTSFLARPMSYGDVDLYNLARPPMDI